jgi:hypothetical protein
MYVLVLLVLHNLILLSLFSRILKKGDYVAVTIPREKGELAEYVAKVIFFGGLPFLCAVGNFFNMYIFL